MQALSFDSYPYYKWRWIIGGVDFARSLNKLTAVEVKAAEPGKYCDGGGLWLVKQSSGSGKWVFRAKVHGRCRAMGCARSGPGCRARAPMGLEWFGDIAPAMVSPYIVKGVIDEGAMYVIYGPLNSGKTFFAMDLVFNIAIGAAWRGRRIKQSSILYLAEEGGRGILNRVVALKQKTGICNVPMAIKRAGLDLLRDSADVQHFITCRTRCAQCAPASPTSSKLTPCRASWPGAMKTMRQI